MSHLWRIWCRYSQQQQSFGTGQPQTNIEPKLMESSITSAGRPGRAQSGKVFSALKLLTGSAASSSHLQKHLSSLLYLREDAQWNIYHAEIALGRRVVHLEQVQSHREAYGSVNLVFAEKLCRGTSLNSLSFCTWGRSIKSFLFQKIRPFLSHVRVLLVSSRTVQPVCF